MVKLNAEINTSIAKTFIFYLIFLLVLCNYIKPDSYLFANHYKKGTIKLNELFRIDDEAIHGIKPLGGSISMAIGKDDSLLVSDFKNNRILVFSRVGKFLASIGQEGNGPGDLHGPADLAYSDGKILVWEIINERFSLFKINGEFLKHIKPKTLFSQIDKVKGLAGGGFVFEEIISSRNFEEEMLLINRMSANGEIIVPLYSQKIKKHRIIRKPSFQKVWQPFFCGVSWAISPDDQLYVGYQGDNKIETINLTNGDKKTFSYEFPRIRVTEADREKLMRNLIITGGDQQLQRAIRENMVFPEFKPAHSLFLVDSKANLLVSQHISTDSKKAEEKNRLVAFSPKRELLGSFSFSDVLFSELYRTVFDTKGDLWILRIDDSDNMYIAKYGISR